MNTTNYNIKDNSPMGKRDYSWNENEVKALRKLVETDDKSLTSRTDDIFLLSFLRARKFDRERAFKLLKSYYATRQQHPAIFRNFTPSSSLVKQCLDDNIMGYFQHTEENGEIIGIGRISYWDPRKLHVYELAKSMLMLMDMLMNDHMIQVNGLILLIDTAGATWRHAIQFTPRTAYRCVEFLQGNYPIRYKQIHLINTSTLVHAVVATFMPFLPYKLRKRIHVHSSNMDSLHKFVHPKHLPSEYGGELPPYDPKESVKKLRKYEEVFVQNEKYWTVEKS